MLGSNSVRILQANFRVEFMFQAQCCSYFWAWLSYSSFTALSFLKRHFRGTTDDCEARHDAHSALSHYTTVHTGQPKRPGFILKWYRFNFVAEVKLEMLFVYLWMSGIHLDQTNKKAIMIIPWAMTKHLWKSYPKVYQSEKGTWKLLCNNTEVKVPKICS